jgi:hypothetical protein
MKTVQTKEGLYIRIGFVGYRDFGCDEQKMGKHFMIKDFTENLSEMRKFIFAQKANGGIDFQEDVSGGIKKGLNLSWDQDALK